jgi:bla regulator protein BlaR1
MASESIFWLLRLTLWTSIALTLVLAIRVPLRRIFGAVLSYQSWLIVPLVTWAACWPTHAMPVLHVAPAVQHVQALAARIIPAQPAQVDVLLVLWAVGALALAARFVHGHRAFLRAAGPLQRSGGVYCSAGGVGPASVGLLRPKIIVPHDFTQRYTPAQQALVLAHEQVHGVRYDALANLLQAVFQCAFWFHPLVHFAALRFRHDQELSCDARVLAQHPGQRRSYAEALLASHAVPAPQGGLHCHWQTHLTKERLMQLQSTLPGLSRRVAGRCLFGLLVAGAVFGTLTARADQAAAAPTYLVAMTIDAEGAQSTPHILVREGEQAAVATGPWRVEMTVRAAQTAGNVWVTSKVYKDTAVIGTPTLLVHVNEKAGIKAGDGADPLALSLVVTPQP